MSNTDGPAALRRIAGDFELTKAACWNESDTASLWELAAAWDAERQAYRSAIEEADRLRFAAEAQAAADRAALERATLTIEGMIASAKYAAEHNTNWQERAERAEAALEQLKNAFHETERKRQDTVSALEQARALLAEWRNAPYFKTEAEYRKWVSDYGPRVDAALGQGGAR